MSQIRNWAANGLVGGLACVAFLHIAKAEAGTERVVYSFCRQENCTDGREPLAGLVNVHDTLYGTTVYGSKNGLGAGTVFSVNPQTGAERVVHVFRYLYKGVEPYAGLINVHGKLYGTTENGGGGGGTVFSVNPRTGAENVVASFEGEAISYPYAGLIDVDGVLYGTTQQGGTDGWCANNDDGCGTVFSVDPKTGMAQVVHAFQNNNTDGQAPAAGLVDVDGTLYGTTVLEGAGAYNEGDAGTVFSVNPKTGAEALVYSFCSQPYCADGANPLAGLINVHGILYGTTVNGGNRCSNGTCGTVFSFDPKTGTEKAVYSFCSQQNCADGRNPVASLVDVGGVLYGTTRGDFPNGIGNVFAVTP